jgi:hypothetical protein
MTGEAHWLTLLLLTASAVGIALLFYSAARLNRRYRLTRRRFECPVKVEDVEATMIRDEKTGELTSVQSCSHFANPAKVTCDQKCLEVLNVSSATGIQPPISFPRPLPAKRTS